MTSESLQAFTKIREELLKLVYFWAHRYKSNSPGCEFDDLCQNGELKLLEIFQSSAYKGKSKGELLAILRKSLRHTMIDSVRNKTTLDKVETRVDLEDASYIMGESGFEDLYLQHVVDYLSHFVSEDAKLLLTNLIHPSSEVIHEDLKRSLRREHVKKQGFHVVNPPKLTHNLVGFVLGFSESKTKLLVRELQLAYCNHAVFLSGAPCPRLYYSLKLS